MNFDESLRKYAELIIKVGVNIQKDQLLMIKAPIEGAEFARKLTKCAYDAGARKVYVEYHDEELAKITYSHASEEALGEFPSWIAKGYDELAEKNAAFITIAASNPDLLKDVPPNKFMTYQRAAGKALENYKRYITNSDVTWCVVSMPTKDWSKKIFPDYSSEKSVEMLWDKIFEVNRIYADDPVKAWKEHTDHLRTKYEALNAKKIKSVKYTAPGTELTVTLPENHIWLGGGEYSSKGIYFVANMPTEEVFTVPHKYGAEGTLTATKPMNYGGTLIEDFTLTFKEGKIVDYTAKKGYDMLKEIIETDEGSHYLGEIAIVPHSSPVSSSNTIFFNTLFDENASCHFAIGNCYPTCIKDGAKMKKEDLEKAGGNTSMIHEDFMVGCKELTIEATTVDEEVFNILKDGEWAFE